MFHFCALQLYFNFVFSFKMSQQKHINQLDQNNKFPLKKKNKKNKNNSLSEETNIDETTKQEMNFTKKNKNKRDKHLVISDEHLTSYKQIDKNKSISKEQSLNEKLTKTKKNKKLKVENENVDEIIFESETIHKEASDNDSCRLSEESDIDLDEAPDDLHKRMRKFKKRQLPNWDLENVDYPKDNGNVISQDLLSKAPLHQLFPRICNISSDEAAQIKRNNIKWIRGKFTEQENNILKANWEKYLEDNHIPNAALLFGMFRRGIEFDSKLKDYYRLYFKNSKLMLRLSKDLPNRRLQQIYQRARVLFVGLKKGSDFTDEDQKLILKLHKTHGEKYAMFCEKYGFNPKAAREFIRNNANNGGLMFKRGSWSDDEVEKLRNIVKDYMSKEGLTSYDKISWAWVSSQMKRSDMQCRTKFYSKAVYQLMSRECNLDWDKDLDFAKFITLLKKMKFEDEFQIDWDFINQIFGVQLFNVLHSAWRANKFQVPENDKKSLSEIIEYIYSKKVDKKFGHIEEKMRLINEFVDNALD